MRKNYLMSLLCLLFMALAPTAQANVDKIYGVTSINEFPDMYPDRTPSFVYGNNDWDHHIIAPIDSNDPAVVMSGGANCNGTYYGLLAKNNVAQKFVTVDWETGTTTEIAALDASYPVFTDMAYNYSTKKLYGMAKASAGGRDFYEIALADGNATKVATIADDLQSFDFSFDGRLHTFYLKKYETYYGENDVLYVKSYDENFENPTEEKLVGSGWDDFILIWGTRINVEFDHMTGTLYYAECGNSQQYAQGIDINNWKQNGASVMLGSSYPDFTSLYIPFTAPAGGADTPTAVTELKATADQSGESKATLSWNNPSINFAGGELTQIYSIRIYRNSISSENLLHEITENVNPGEPMSWTDENAAKGNNTYVVVPCRIEGEEGISAEVSVWVGYDTPVAVSGIKMEKVENGINVSWEKPASTINGGVLDLTTLKYKVVRKPDNITITEGTTETTVLDTNPLPTWQRYSYEITAMTSAGDSEPTDGYAGIFAGPDFTAPYEFGFDNSDFYESTWTTIGDDMGVGYLDYSYRHCWLLMLPGWAHADYGKRNNYLISPEITLTKGKYTISVGSWIELANDSNAFTLLYGKGKTVESLTNTIESFSFTAAEDGQRDMATVTFEIPEDGTYNFAMNVTAPITNPDTYGNVGITLFKIEESTVETFKVTGKVADTEGEAIEGATVTMQNNGRQFKATTAADGTFAVNLEGNAGEYTITVEKEGYETYSSTLTLEGVDFNLETITMKQATAKFKVTGKVADTEGEAVNGASVTVQYDTYEFTATTAADGTFTVDAEGLKGEYTIAIDAEGYEAYTGRFTFEGTDIDLGTIEMARISETFFVTGKVTDSDGNAIADATVTMGMDGNDKTIMTAADGTFNLEMFGTRGEYAISVTKDTYVPYTGTFTFEGTDVALEDIVLQKTSGIEGIEFDADGNADITVYDMSGRLVKSGKVTRSEGLGLAKGIYIVNGQKTVVK